MSREKAAMLTQTEHPKARFRAVFVSLHGDAKRYPGGVTALAHELGMIPAVLADKLSPNIFDKEPTVRELLEVFERTHGVPTAMRWWTGRWMPMSGRPWGRCLMT